MNKDDLETARVLAQQLLESGLAFEHEGKNRHPFHRKYGNKAGWKGDKNVAMPIYDPEQIRDLRLTPTKLLQDQIREMLLSKHAEHQSRRSRGTTPGREFYAGKAWQTLRYRVLSERGNRCECCGAGPDDGVRLDVDHIKPRSRYPELALDKSNLQVLCQPCNMGKSNRHEDDWRKRKRVLVKKSQ